MALLCKHERWNYNLSIRMQPAPSVTKLGDFLKFLVTNYLQKVAKTCGDFLGLSEKHHFQVKTVVATFWATFVYIRATFYFNVWLHCLPPWFTWTHMNLSLDNVVSFDFVSMRINDILMSLVLADNDQVNGDPSFSVTR